MRVVKPDLRKPQYVRKTQQISDLRGRLEKCAASVLIEYRGMKVADTTELRNRLRKVNAELGVIKNTLMKRVVSDAKRTRPILGDLEALLEGPTAVMFAFDDSISAVKTLSDFTKDNRFLLLKGGYVEGRVYDAAQLGEIAKMPPKEQIYAQLLGSLQGPAANLVGMLQAPMSQLVFTLKAVAERETAEAA